MSGSSPQRLRELIVLLGHEPLAEIPDVAEAIETEALEILDALVEQIGALTSERDLAMKAHHEALVAHGYEKQQKHGIEHEKARLQEWYAETVELWKSQTDRADALEKQLEAYERALVEIGKPFSGVDPNLQRIARDVLEEFNPRSRLADLFSLSNPATKQEKP